MNNIYRNYFSDKIILYLAGLLVNGGAAAAHAGPRPEDLLLHHGQGAADALPPELGGGPGVTRPLAVTLPQIVRRHDVRGHSCDKRIINSTSTAKFL